MNWLLLLIGAALAIMIVRQMQAARPSLTAAAAHEAVQAGSAVLIDVREPAEWADGVGGPAVLLPMSDFAGDRAQWSPFLARERGRRLIVYCASGVRSSTVARQLQREGFDAVNLGGFARWRQAGLPVRAGR